MYRKIPQIAFALLILLNLTNLFVFASTWFGVSLTITGGGMIIAMVAYIIAERRIFASIVVNPVYIYCSVLFLVWPFLYYLFSAFKGYNLTRELVLQVYYLLLLTGTMIFVIRNGLLATRKVVLICYLVTIAGILAQTFYPSAFFRVALAAEEVSGSFTYGRAGGFFINPNTAARFVTLIFLMLMLSPRHISMAKLLGYSSITFLTVLLTASRSSAVIAMVAIVGVFIVRYAVPWVKGRRIFAPERLFLSALGGLSLAVLLYLGLSLGGKFLLENSDLGNSVRASDRLLFFTTGFSGFVSVIQEEAEGRYATVEPFLPEFKENWILGTGLAGHRIYRAQNGIPLTPHNTLFTVWFDYGVAYFLALLYAVGAFLVSQKTRRVERHLNFSFSYVFVAVMLLVSFTYDGLVVERPTYVILGFFLAGCVAPSGWFEHDARHSQLKSLGKSRSRRF